MVLLLAALPPYLLKALCSFLVALPLFATTSLGVSPLSGGVTEVVTVAAVASAEIKSRAAHCSLCLRETSLPFLTFVVFLPLEFLLLVMLDAVSLCYQNARKMPSHLVNLVL